MEHLACMLATEGSTGFPSAAYLSCLAWMVTWVAHVNISCVCCMRQAANAAQEWLGMMTQHLFGPKAGIFKQCPHDPATVHPISSHERSQGLPDAPNYMNLAGRLAGAAPCMAF